MVDSGTDITGAGDQVPRVPPGEGDARIVVHDCVPWLAMLTVAGRQIGCATANCV